MGFSLGFLFLGFFHSCILSYLLGFFCPGLFLGFFEGFLFLGFWFLGFVSGILFRLWKDSSERVGFFSFPALTPPGPEMKFSLQQSYHSILKRKLREAVARGPLAGRWVVAGWPGGRVAGWWWVVDIDGWCPASERRSRWEDAVPCRRLHDKR